MQTLLQAVVAFLLIIQAGNYPQNVKNAAITVANDALVATATTTVSQVTGSAEQNQTSILAQISALQNQEYQIRSSAGADIRAIEASNINPQPLIDEYNDNMASQLASLNAQITTLQNEY